MLQHFEIRRNGEGFHLLYFGWKSHICVGILVKQGFFSCCVINKDADLHPLSVSFYPTAGGGNDPTSMEPRSLFFFSCGWVPNTACCSTPFLQLLCDRQFEANACVCVCVWVAGVCGWLIDVWFFVLTLQRHSHFKAAADSLKVNIWIEPQCTYDKVYILSAHYNKNYGDVMWPWPYNLV